MQLNTKVMDKKLCHFLQMLEDECPLGIAEFLWMKTSLVRDGAVRRFEQPSRNALHLGLVLQLGRHKQLGSLLSQVCKAIAF